MRLKHMQRVPTFDNFDPSIKLSSAPSGRIDSLDSEPYYFDSITIEKANDVLKSFKKDGAFLVRKRTTGDTQSQPYALAVYGNNKVHHIRINRDQNGNFCCCEVNDPKTRKFESIQEMIKYLDGNDKTQIKITTKYNNRLEWFKRHPSNQEDFSEIDPLESLPYYLKNVSQSDVEKYLKLFHENDAFFIRKLTEIQYHVDCQIPYELLVYHKSSVYQLRIFRSLYEQYSIEFNESKNFDSIPDMIKHFNYSKIKLSDRSETSVCLRIPSRYVVPDIQA